MHHLQKAILFELALNQHASFTQLQPDDVSNNSFAYHLKQLVERGYVLQRDDGQYELTTKSMALLERLSWQTKQVREQPRLLTMLLIHAGDGRLIAFQRKHQPFIDRYSLPSGKVHLGESIDAAARRELAEKTRLEDVELQPRGILNFVYRDGDQIVTHGVAHVYEGQTDQQVDFATRKGRAHVVAADGEVDWLPEASAVLMLAEQPEFFHCSKSYQM